MCPPQSGHVGSDARMDFDLLCTPTQCLVRKQELQLWQQHLMEKHSSRQSSDSGEGQWPGDEAGKTVCSSDMLAAEKNEGFGKLGFCEENITDNMWHVGAEHRIGTSLLVVPGCQVHRYCSVFPGHNTSI